MPKTTHAWYAHWFDEDYLSLYAHRNEDDASLQLDLIRNSVQIPTNGVVLDLCCGDGRHAEIMRRWGWKVVGLDLSAVLLKKAAQRIPDLPLIQGDMRAIPGRFSAVLSLFTSFGYFDTHQENQRVFAQVADALHKHGVFWLDFLNPPYVKANLIETECIATVPGEQATIYRRISEGQVIKEIMMGRRKIVERVWLYTVADLCQMAQDNRLVIRNLFGDYQGHAHHEFSPRTILFMEKQ